MSFCSFDIANFEFAKQEIEKARKRSGLLSMEIELSLRCNFKCPYCYVEGEADYSDELSNQEIESAVLQAKALGAKKIILLGGEPMIHPHILDLIRFIRGHDLDVEMFTNGSKITTAIAEELYRNQVRVVLKMNSFEIELQNRLCGIPNAHQVIHNAFTNLKKAGFPGNGSLMAVSTVVCKQNIDQLSEFWQWLRDQNILPYFEMITPQSNAKQNNWLFVEPDQVHQLFNELSEIDRVKYGNEWVPQPPLAGNRCLRHQFSCVVTSIGDVIPCVGVTISAGNIRNKSLEQILKESEVFENLRNFQSSITGPCGTCEKSDYCYGCRGAAYQITGDYLASDPLCWKIYQPSSLNTSQLTNDSESRKLCGKLPDSSVA
jgi:radical SAM protein with 4Fe4S-binding SPASM domain